MEKIKKNRCGRHKLPENSKKQRIAISIEPKFKKQLERDIEDGKITSISALFNNLIKNYYKNCKIME